MRWERIKIYSWEDKVYKVSPYPGDASKAQLIRPFLLLSSMCNPLPGKALSQTERADGTRALSKNLKDIEKPGEARQGARALWLL